MKLYHWKSEFLRQYADGDILTIANSVEEARQNVLKQFEEYVADVYDYLDITYEGDLEQYNEYKSKFLEDISKEPKVLETIFIDGSW